MEVTFEIPGEPKGKQRPRFSRISGHAFTPQQTRNYEAFVRLMYVETCKDMKLQGAISAKIVAVFPIPKSTSKKNRALMLEGKIHHTKLGDIDNIVKSVMDGVQGVAFDDDKQIAELYAAKMYGENPKVIVNLKEIGT